MVLRDPNEILEPYRSYLMVLASVHLAPELRSKIDPADLVQQTFLRATNALSQLRAVDTAGIAVWLRTILANELQDVYKHFHRDKRDIALERSIERDLAQSSSRMEAWLEGNFTSPSHKASQNEQLILLANALAELPETMREVVVLKHYQGWTLEQISYRLNRTVPAIASLLRRGLQQLRKKLNPEDHVDD